MSCQPKSAEQRNSFTIALITNIPSHEKLNAIYELGFIADGFQDRFLELAARTPENSPIATEIEKLPLDLLIPDDIQQERSDVRWYRGRFTHRVSPLSRVRISVERRPMLDLLTTITALAAPQVLAAESTAFRSYKARIVELQRFENRRYLNAHGRTMRSTR